MTQPHDHTPQTEPNKYEWRRVFAALPRCVQGRWIWLPWYEARRDYSRPHMEERRMIED